MTAAFTIILPHKRNPGNDAALAVALDCLMANTRSDFALMIDAAADSPLVPRINCMVEHAPTECCVYWASDTFAAPGWDTAMLELFAPDTFVNGVLVEPGAIGVYAENFQKDFGRRPDTFRRAEFDAWCEKAEVPAGEGWYCPYMFPRSGWLAHGGLMPSTNTDHHGFTGADMDLFGRWKASGNRVVRARSYAYHLQRYSDVAEQQHEKRSGI
jgi:hypothetical protein